jgi:hypothetical protein
MIGEQFWGRGAGGYGCSRSTEVGEDLRIGFENFVSS